MFHEVISKRTSALNQLRDGLKILGVLEVIENNPSLCLPLFTYETDSLTAEKVGNVLRFDDSCSNEMIQYVLKYLTLYQEKDIEKFVKFVTGATILPATIHVKVDDKSDGVFASTCSNEITLPKNIEQFEKLRELLDTIIMTGGKSFTTV